MAYAYTVGTLLIEDTFTRSGALGSTESGSLGSLAWIGDTAKLPCNGSEAVAVNPANAVGVIGNVYVNVPAGLSVRVAAETNSAAFDSFANAYLDQRLVVAVRVVRPDGLRGILMGCLSQLAQLEP